MKSKTKKKGVKHSLSSLSYQLSHEDLGIIQDYLKEKKKVSKGVYRNHKSILLSMLDFVKKPIEFIGMLDMKRFLEENIDQRDIQKESKETYRSNLISFFDYCTGYYLDKQRELRNPVPNKKVFKFTKKNDDIKRQTEKKGEIFSKKEIRDLLEKAKAKKYRDFILFGLLTQCGMRIREALTIKIRDINFKENYLETGFEKGARKTSGNTDETLIFFFTDTFKTYLKQYIVFLGEEKWLFPGRKSYYKYGSFRTQIRRNYPNKFRKTHSFRKSLITYRTNMGCPLYISEVLTNHTPSSTQGKNYIKKPIEIKRRDFNRWNPYRDFKYF